MSMSERAQALLDAQVAFAIEQMQGKAFDAWLERSIAETLEDASKLKLEETVSRKLVKATVAELAQQIVLDEAVQEMIAKTARAVRESEAHDEATLGDLLTEETWTEGRDKAIAMQDLREAAIRAAMDSKAYQAFVADMLYHGIKGWLNDNPLTQNVPGAKAAMTFGRSLMNRARPGMSDTIDETLHDYIDKSVHATAKAGERYLLGISDEALARAADAVWKEARKMSIEQIAEHVSSEDVEDWAGIVYRGLHHLRGTGYFTQVVDAGVDAFFDHYGKASLTQILDEFGVTAEIMAQEARRYAVPVIKLLQKKKLLDTAVRRQLQPFYESEACAAILGD